MDFGLGLNKNKLWKHPRLTPYDNPQQHWVLQTFPSSYQQPSKPVEYLEVQQPPGSWGKAAIHLQQGTGRCCLASAGMSMCVWPGEGLGSPSELPSTFLSYCDRGAGSGQELKLSRPHHASSFPPSMALGCLTHATCSSSCRPKEEQNISFLHTGRSHSECKQDLCYNNANSIA